MSQHNVDRLKELLFERESREIGSLTQRLDSIAERAGGDIELRRSVARVIDGALRDAEETRHRELNQALAPVIQRTFRQEIRSPETQSELENALYPKLGVMVQRYIASAMRDLMENINHRLESGLTQNRLALKLRSLTSGRSMAELALADTQKFQVEELYLIRRGSGELIHRWSRLAIDDQAPRPGSNRDTLVSGFLTAITSFAEEAFADDKSMLRALELDSHRIYLRASPAYLVAAKTSGSAEASLEQVLDTTLIDILNKHQEIENQFPFDAGPDSRTKAAHEHQAALGQSSDTLEAAITTAEAELRKSRGSLRPAKFLLTLVGLLVAGYFGWQYYVRTITANLQVRAEAIINSTPGVAGYPISVRVDPGGQAIWVNGLAPVVAARDHIVTELQRLAPQATLHAAIGVLPQSDVDAALAIRATQQSARTAKRRIERARMGIAQLDIQAPPEAADNTKQAQRALTDAVTITESASNALQAEALLPRIHDAIRLLSAVQQRLSGLAENQASSDTSPQLPGTPAEALDELGGVAERLAGSAAILEQVGRQSRLIIPLEQQNSRLARDVDALTRQLAALQPKPRDHLLAFTRSNAVFFSTGTEFREPQAAKTTIDQLAALAMTTDELIRVVGYTDEAGTGPRNQSISQQRAERVTDELISRGVPRNRLLAVGRATNMDIVPRTGTSSSNRRVEFEIGFIGEGSTSQ